MFVNFVRFDFYFPSAKRTSLKETVFLVTSDASLLLVQNYAGSKIIGKYLADRFRLPSCVC